MTDNIVFLHVQPHAAIGENFTLEEISNMTGAPVELLQRIVDEEIVRPIDSTKPEFRLDRHGLAIVERSLRLHHELGVNLSGVAIIEDLLDQIASMREDLIRRTYIGGEARDAGWE